MKFNNNSLFRISLLIGVILLVVTAGFVLILSKPNKSSVIVMENLEDNFKQSYPSVNTKSINENTFLVDRRETSGSNHDNNNKNYNEDSESVNINHFSNDLSDSNNIMGINDNEKNNLNCDLEEFNLNNKIIVRENEDLQKALDSSNFGDIIELEAGKYYEGNFILPKKEGDGWVAIISSEIDKLPNNRVNPEDMDNMPKIISPNSQPALKTEEGAHNFIICGVEFLPSSNSYSFGLIVLGDNDEIPYNLIIEKSYIHGDPNNGGKRGIALNSRSTEIRDSYISDWKGIGEDTQAIAGWSGPGDYKIINNYIEGSGENILFGGASPGSNNLVPSNIKIKENYFSKPMKWNKHSNSYDGSSWTIKNLLELKNARDVVIEDNIFENNWADAQNGFAIVFTPRNQDNDAPWTVVEDVKFRNNIVRNSAAVINILGEDDNAESKMTNNILIENNLFDNIGGDEFGGQNSKMIQILGPTRDITFNHNTMINYGSILIADQGLNEGFKFTNNIAYHNDYGILGSGKGSGDSALDYFPGGEFKENIIIGTWPSPAGIDIGLYSTFGRNNLLVNNPNDIKFDSEYKLSSNLANINTNDFGMDTSILKEIFSKVLS